jgi:hypothetical protein
LVLFWTSKKEQAKNKVRQKLTRLMQSADCFVPRNDEEVVARLNVPKPLNEAHQEILNQVQDDVECL